MNFPLQNCIFLLQEDLLHTKKKRNPRFYPPKKNDPNQERGKEVCNFFNTSETQQKTSTKIGPVTLLAKKITNKCHAALHWRNVGFNTQKKTSFHRQTPSHGRDPLILKGTTPGENFTRDILSGRNVTM